MKIAILFFLSFASLCEGEVLLKDKFVFKLSNEVFSLNDLAEYKKQMINLSCIYPESLLYQIFQEHFLSETKDIFVIQNKFNKQQKKYFLGLRSFGKLLVYSKSYDVTIKEELTKYLYLSAKSQKCDMSAFNKKKKFTNFFKDLIHLEIFLRARFLPSENEGKTTATDVKKAVTGVRNLIRSIEPQVEEEVYW